MPIIDFHTHRTTAEGVITPRCFGIHPWNCAQADLSLLSIQNPEFKEAEIVGECGLDKCCDTPLDTQMEFFVRQIEIAEHLHKPLVIHCVRSFNELTELRRDHRATPWVVHGFTGSTELYTQLTKLDIGVSFGAAILDPQRTKVRETLAAADPYRIFLETDDSGADIHEIYRTAKLITKNDNLEGIIKQHWETLNQTADN